MIININICVFNNKIGAASKKKLTFYFDSRLSRLERKMDNFINEILIPESFNIIAFQLESKIDVLKSNLCNQNHFDEVKKVIFTDSEQDDYRDYKDLENLNKDTVIKVVNIL